MACRIRTALAIAISLGLSACHSLPVPQELPSPMTRPPAPSPAAPPAASTPPSAATIQNIPDAVPRWEARSHDGNPLFYEVYGKRYYVLSTSNGYVEQGVASWYGPGFHAERTSGGERYDMYAMTAAHKTLPLPAYVRVTNLQNGRSIVVRVNDRGPFVGNRLIDLSYTAAAKLDMLVAGTAMVEVRVLDSPQPTLNPTPLVSHSSLFVQAGAFSDLANAEKLAQRLRTDGYGQVLVRGAEHGRQLYRVRIGPVSDVSEFDRIVAALEHAGINNARLAPN